MSARIFIYGKWEDPETYLFRTYLRKPLIIRAVRLPSAFTISTETGMLQGKAGDYIVCDTDGRFFPCAEEDFLEANKRWYFYCEEHNPYLEGSGEYERVLDLLLKLSERMRARLTEEDANGE